MVETRGKKRKAADGVASTYTGTSVILLDLQLHTTDIDVMNMFEKLELGRPKISFIDRDYKTTKFTYCCEVDFGSVDLARQALVRESYLINNSTVRVIPFQERVRVAKGKYRLKILDMNEYKNGRAVFRLLRDLVEKCSCSDIQIVKNAQRCNLLEGCAKLRFRTKKGRDKAVAILKDYKDDLAKVWTFHFNEDEEADEDEAEF